MRCRRTRWVFRWPSSSSARRRGAIGTRYGTRSVSTTAPTSQLARTAPSASPPGPSRRSTPPASTRLRRRTPSSPSTWRSFERRGSGSSQSHHLVCSSPRWISTMTTAPTSRITRHPAATSWFRTPSGCRAMAQRCLRSSRRRSSTVRRPRSAMLSPTRSRRRRS